MYVNQQHQFLIKFEEKAQKFRKKNPLDGFFISYVKMIHELCQTTCRVNFSRDATLGLTLFQKRRDMTKLRKILFSMRTAIFYHEKSKARGMF